VIKELLLGRRALVEMKKQRMAMERIATCLEELLLQQKKSTGTGLSSLYRGTEDGGVLNQSDEDFATLEALEQERERAGGEVSMDEELEGEWR
jgi:hypothetical protein